MNGGAIDARGLVAHFKTLRFFFIRISTPSPRTLVQLSCFFSGKRTKSFLVSFSQSVFQLFRLGSQRPTLWRCTEEGQALAVFLRFYSSSGPMEGTAYDRAGGVCSNRNRPTLCSRRVATPKLASLQFSTKRPKWTAMPSAISKKESKVSPSPSPKESR
eukprot:GHVT01075945.1.p2 GENE.GHVT01075945.1~~GHVT01075945.1.p2  ORF type:complete len:159 (-),score=13.29 GHVT01075945.1:428-904(-)